MKFKLNIMYQALQQELKNDHLVEVTSVKLVGIYSFNTMDRCSMLQYVYSKTDFKNRFLDIYIHIWPMLPFSKDYHLASHTTYVVCIYLHI